MENEFLKTEEEIVKMLRTVFDPEIPVNIYDMGLVYGIEVTDEHKVFITMTLTAPNCPVADSLPIEVRGNILMIEGVKDAQVDITFDPPWTMDMMSEEAKLELGFL